MFSGENKKKVIKIKIKKKTTGNNNKIIRNRFVRSVKVSETWNYIDQ